MTDIPNCSTFPYCDKKNIERWRRSAIDQILSTFSKEELTKELCKREGVKTISVTAKNTYANIEEFGMGSDWLRRTPVVSPARILVVKE